MLRKTVLFAAIVSSVIFVLPAATAGTPGEVQPMYWHESEERIDGAFAEIFRSEDGVSFTIKTFGLKKDHAYTAWFFAFNHPENCQGGADLTQNGKRCHTHEDLLNPAAFSSLMWGNSGKYLKGNGATWFRGFRPKNFPPCVYPDIRPECEGVLIGPGLLQPMTAEIHFVIRDHGPDQEGVEDETTTINGGCQLGTGIPVYSLPGYGEMGTYACNDPQLNSGHLE